MSQTIAAAATALAPSAIGIIRISGADAIAMADKIFRAKKPLAECESHRLVLGDLLDEKGRVLDRIQATVSRAPNSYTGEDTAELFCHGSPAVMASALAALFSLGARQALAGEFTRRAFLNGKMDLTQAEAVIDLIEAQSAEAAANAAAQVGGALSAKVLPVYDALVDLLSHFHAVLDYPDEEIEPFRLENYRSMLRNHRDTLKTLEAGFERGQVLKNGIRAVIVGSPNAGKSSLLNALAGYERVIVTEFAGTTRDTVEERIRFGKNILRLTDTAGIRETEDRIERRGVEMAQSAAQGADLALFVCDGTKPLTENDRAAMEAAGQAKKCIALINKADLPLTVTPEMLPFERVLIISAAQGTGLSELESAVEELFSSDMPADGSIITNVRQKDAVEKAVRALTRTLDALESGLTPDAVLTDVEDALNHLGELTGKRMREEIVSRIFERFCVGK